MNYPVFIYTVVGMLTISGLVSFAFGIIGIEWMARLERR
jgi:hypothetical protein